MKLPFSLALLFLAAHLIAAQEFEVASFKRNLSAPSEPSGGLKNGRLTVTNIPLRYLLARHGSCRWMQ